MIINKFIIFTFFYKNLIKIICSSDLDFENHSFKPFLETWISCPEEVFLNFFPRKLFSEIADYILKKENENVKKTENPIANERGEAVRSDYTKPVRLETEELKYE